MLEIVAHPTRSYQKNQRLIIYRTPLKFKHFNQVVILKYLFVNLFELIASNPKEGKIIQALLSSVERSIRSIHKFRVISNLYIRNDSNILIYSLYAPRSIFIVGKKKKKKRGTNELIKSILFNRVYAPDQRWHETFATPMEFNILDEAPTEIPSRSKRPYFRIDLHSARSVNKYLWYTYICIWNVVHHTLEKVFHPLSRLTHHE